MVRAGLKNEEDDEAGDDAYSSVTITSGIMISRLGILGVAT